MAEKAEEIPAYTTVHDRRCPFDPQPELYQVRESAGPIGRVRLWSGKEAWLISGYEDSRAILGSDLVSSDTNHPNFPHQLPGMKASQQSSTLILNMDNPRHDIFRRFLAPDFMIRKINALRPAIQQIVDQSIDAMLAGPRPADLVADFALPLPSEVVSRLLGVPREDHEYFQRLANLIVSSDATEEQSRESTAEIRAYFGKLAEAKRAEPSDDLISRLARHWANGDISLEELIGAGHILLVGGHESTANLIALATVALLQHPDQLAELRDSDDPAFIAGAVEELLRYIHLFHSGRRRIAVRDFEVAGQTVHAGDGLILAGNLADRDPSAFGADADQLDIHRDARHHVAFGFGIHQCLGQPLARAELQIALPTLYRRIPGLRLAVEQSELSYKQSNLNGLHSLPVTW